MKKEDKELLLRDLSARLPYGVQAQVDRHVNPLQILGISKLHKNTWAWKKGTYVAFFWNDTKAIELIKPYLRPLSSMTDEEEDEYEEVIRGSFEKQLEFYLRNHLDFRGLIPKGLALEAPKDMYNEIKEEKK